MFERPTPRGILILLLGLLAVNVVTVSLGSDGSSLTIVNKTEHFLHVFIDDDQFLYVAPERSVRYSTEPQPTMYVTILYSPGQDISGVVTDTITVPYRSARQGCNCRSGDGWGDCVYTPPTGGAARWEVVPEELVPSE